MESVVLSCKINVLSNGGGNEIKLIEIYKYLSCIFELEVEMEIRIFWGFK